MKKIMFTLLYIFLGLFCGSQTFRNGFDDYEFNAGNQGQGYSFHSNVIGELNYGEAPYLESYLTMFKATKDKKYLDKFILHSKRVMERRDYIVAFDSIKSNERKISVGVSFGLNRAGYRSTYFLLGNNTSGLSIGIFSNFHFTREKRVLIQVAAMYSDYSFTLEYYNAKYLTYFKFLGINVKTSYRVFDSKKIFLYIGLNTSILCLVENNTALSRQVVPFNTLDFLMEYRLTKKISFAFNIYGGISTLPMKYSYVSPYNEKISYSLSLYPIGVNFLFSYHLNKKTK